MLLASATSASLPPPVHVSLLSGVEFTPERRAMAKAVLREPESEVKCALALASPLPRPLVGPSLAAARESVPVVAPMLTAPDASHSCTMAIPECLAAISVADTGLRSAARLVLQ